MEENKKAIKALKHYLNSAKYWKRRQSIIEEKIEKLRSQAEKTTTTFSDAPSFGGYEDHRQEVIAEMVDEERRYHEAVKECERKRQEIQFFVDNLESYEERNVLEYRYLYFENWQDIAYKLDYHERAVYKIHGRALLHLLDIHKKIIENGGRWLF